MGRLLGVATFALLSAGEKRQDPRMVRAVNFLKSADIVGTYALGVRCQVWSLLPSTPETRRLLQEDAARLLSGQGQRGNATGMWDYLSGPKWVEARKVDEPRFDHSVSQYGVLGLWAAADNGASITLAQWKALDHAWRSHQNSGGGWTYAGAGGEDESGALSMTAAGVATLFITHDMLSPTTGGFCHGNQSDPNIDRGIQWIVKHWAVPNDGYTLFGIERIGAASGLKYLGKYDWYTLGADYLLSIQREDGHWMLGGTGANPVSETAFAMLFLSHGRAPVLISKLDYAVTDEAPLNGPADGGKGGWRWTRCSPPARAPRQARHAACHFPRDATAPAATPATGTPATVPTADEVLNRPWNQRPRDVANLLHQMRGSLEQSYLNWQIVTLGTSLEDMHEGPILFISGNRELEFTPSQQAKLKQFVQEGGLILANSDCPEGDQEPFAQSVRSMFERLFPYKFRPLPASHPILAEEQFKSTRWKDPPVVLGLSNGVRRAGAALPDRRPGQVVAKGRVPHRADGVRAGGQHLPLRRGQAEPAVQGSDLSRQTDRQSDEHFARRGLEVGENWNPEPAGWWRIDALLRNVAKMAVSVAPVVPANGTLNGYNVAPPDRHDRVPAHAGAAAGDPAFRDGRRHAGDRRRRRLPAVRRRRREGAGRDVRRQPRRRRPNPRTRRPPLQPQGRRDRRRGLPPLHAPPGHRQAGRPALRGINVKGRLAVFYSREDLGAGIVGQPVDGITGYTPESATAIMRNILLYAAGAK